MRILCVNVDHGASSRDRLRNMINQIPPSSISRILCWSRQIEWSVRGLRLIWRLERPAISYYTFLLSTTQHVLAWTTHEAWSVVLRFPLCLVVFACASKTCALLKNYADYSRGTIVPSLIPKCNHPAKCLNFTICFIVVWQCLWLSAQH